MKKRALVIVCLSFVLAGCARYRRADEIALIAELPNTPEFAIDGVFVNIGIAYNTIHIFHFNRRWVLFSGNTYWTFDREYIEEIAQSAGIILPDDMTLPFLHEWGPRIALLAGAIIAVLGIFLYYKFKKLIRPKEIVSPFSSLAYNKRGELYFHYYYKIKTVNSIPLKKYWLGFIPSGLLVLPLGVCAVTYNYDTRSLFEKIFGGDYSTGKNLLALGIIEAGKKYVLKHIRNNKTMTILSSLIPVQSDAEFTKYLGEFEGGYASTETWEKYREAAFSLYSQQKYDEVIAECNKALEMYSYDAYMYTCRGMAYSNNGDFANALKDAYMAITINPNDETLKKNLANTQAQQEKEKLIW